MRRFLILLISLLLWSACGSLPETPPTPPEYDFRADVDRFLAAEPGQETQALENLNKNEVPLPSLKSYLRELSAGRGGPPGRHPGQPFQSDGRTYGYALSAPETLVPGTTYPLVVVLHGMGGSGETTLEQWTGRLGGDFILVCPSYPMGAWWSRRAEEFVLGLIEDVRRRYPVDSNRVFLAGLSNGAIGAYLIGMYHPDRFAGIAPIAGAVTERYMHFLVNLKNTAVYSIQGRHDPIFPISFSRRIHKIMTDLNYPFIYREHEERGLGHGGHFLPDSEVPALVAWMKAIRRQPYSDIVRMVREGNHLQPIQWVRVSRGQDLAALQIPGPETKSLNIRDGKIATLMATHKSSNLFEIVGKNVLEFEIYLDAERVDFSQPVTVTFQELREEKNKFVAGPRVVSFEGPVQANRETLLRSYRDRRDPDLLFDAVVKIGLDPSGRFARLP